MNWPWADLSIFTSSVWRGSAFSGIGRSWLPSALCPFLSLVDRGTGTGPEAVSWEHLVKEFVVFNLEKRRLGLGVGRRDTVAILDSLRGAGERA